MTQKVLPTFNNAAAFAATTILAGSRDIAAIFSIIPLGLGPANGTRRYYNLLGEVFGRCTFPNFQAWLLAGSAIMALDFITLSTRLKLTAGVVPGTALTAAQSASIFTHASLSPQFRAMAQPASLVAIPCMGLTGWADVSNASY